MTKNRVSLLRTCAMLCAVLGCLSLVAPIASAQRYHHRHRVVRSVRVRRHGHWVTIKRVVWR